MLSFACKKENKSTSTASTTTSATTTGGSTGGSATVNSAIQVSYTMDGTNYTFVDGTGTISNSYNTQTFTGSTNTTQIWSMYLTDTNTGHFVFTASKGTLSYPNGTTVDNATFDAFFPKTNIPYSAGAFNGIGINMYIENDQLTSAGPQTGTGFNIVDKKIVDEGGNHYVKIKANFSCKLYNSSGALKKTITNGVLIAQFKNM
jgi:hypothetical protein